MKKFIMVLAALILLVGCTNDNKDVLKEKDETKEVTATKEPENASNEDSVSTSPTKSSTDTSSNFSMIEETDDDKTFAEGVVKCRPSMEAMAQNLANGVSSDGTYDRDMLQLGIEKGHESLECIKAMGTFGDNTNKYAKTIDSFTEVMTEIIFTTNFYESFLKNGQVSTLQEGIDHLNKFLDAYKVSGTLFNQEKES